MKVSLVVGDWSGDGHEKTDTFVFEIAGIKSYQEIPEAFYAGVKIIGVNINSITSDYENDTISSKDGLLLKAHGYTPRPDTWVAPNGEISLSPAEYAEAYMFTCKVGKPQISYKMVDPERVLNIGGYGLYH